eukprot:m.94603 g.94603  ORF g.94603 m.94603 type:complete len:88 (-) comp12273_c0_seq1:1244-1507(-)
MRHSGTSYNIFCGMQNSDFGNWSCSVAYPDKNLFLSHGYRRSHSIDLPSALAMPEPGDFEGGKCSLKMKLWRMQFARATLFVCRRHI